MNRTQGLLAAAAAGALVAAGALDWPYAVSIASLVPGPNASGDPMIMLGAPDGGGPYDGSMDVYQLGLGGEVILEPGQRIWDGPGTDLVVYENPFLTFAGTQQETWVEALSVEVSTNGIDWVPFPTEYTGPVGPFGLFQAVPMHRYRGFAGVSPASAKDDPTAGEYVEPSDVVLGGGDVFDLADLADHPLVQAQIVDLQDIRFVKLTDVVAGQSTDSEGTVVWDCGDTLFACADVDAIHVKNGSGSTTTGRPWVELTMEDYPNGTYMVLEIGDPDGLWQVIPDIKASINGIEGNFFNLLQYFVFLELDDVHVRLAAGPVVPALPPSQFRVSATDVGGLVGGDAIYFP